jgi:hypothetical protein
MTLSSTFKRLLVAVPVAGVVAGFVVGGVAGASAADTGSTTRPTRSATATADRPTLDDARGRCEQAVDQRLATLDKLSAAVAGRAAVTDDHRATLEGQIAAARDGLTALRASIAADADAASLKAHCREIVEGYRVYLVVVPRTHEVVAADAIVAGADRMSARVGDLATAIDAAEAAGRDVTHDRELLADLQAKVAAARDAAAGVPDTVIGLTAADWNAGTAQPALEAGHATLAQARADLASALTSAKEIVQDLRS